MTSILSAIAAGVLVGLGLQQSAGAIRLAWNRYVRKLKRVQVLGKYTYETDLDVKVGDTVQLPDSGYGPWAGNVTALTSGYTGTCKRIIKIVHRGGEPGLRRRTNEQS